MYLKNIIAYSSTLLNIRNDYEEHWKLQKRTNLIPTKTKCQFQTIEIAYFGEELSTHRNNVKFQKSNDSECGGTQRFAKKVELWQ